MQTIIDFCSIINPLFFLLAGVCILVLYFLNFYGKFKDVKRFSAIDTKKCTKTTGVIKDYETEYEIKLVKKDGKEQQIQIEKYYPIVEYTIDNETYTTRYKKPFFKPIKPTIGYEFPVHINDTGDRYPYILYEDIYFNEIKGAKITMFFVYGFILIITIALTILSAIGQV